MQRAAIARALIAQPDLLLADEPTGNLDQATGQEIIQILRTLNREQKLTIVMVTHDRAIADQADRIVRLASGRVEGIRDWGLGIGTCTSIVSRSGFLIPNPQSLSCH